MSIRQFRPMTAGTRFRSVSRVRRDHPRPRRRSRCSSRCKKYRRPQQQGPPHHAAPGRRAQAAVPEDRLPARTSSAIPAKVAEIEYDPNRTARIALLVYADGEKRYILHPKGLKQGDTVVSGPGSDIRTGNALPLGEIPLGTTVHNVELKIGKGGQMARSAGHERAGGGARKASTSRCGSRSTEMRLVHGALPRHDRRGRQRRARAAVGRQGRQDPLAGPRPEGARRGHEPGGPPAGRRRGQDARAAGRRCRPGASPKAEDPAAEEGVERAHRARTQAREGDRSNDHGTQRQEGPVRPGARCSRRSRT